MRQFVKRITYVTLDFWACEKEDLLKANTAGFDLTTHCSHLLGGRRRRPQGHADGAISLKMLCSMKNTREVLFSNGTFPQLLAPLPQLSAMSKFIERDLYGPLS
jgi:hypothetical protein